MPPATYLRSAARITSDTLLPSDSAFAFAASQTSSGTRTLRSVSGHVAPIAVAREAMGIDWMTREELAEAIPPAYTEHVGAQILAHLEVAA